jgi:type VI secretion system secreted protein Hcp
MKVSKGIKGDVTTEGFSDWIELSSLNWGMDRTVGTAQRGSKSRESTEPQFHELVVTKAYNVASPKLFLAAVGPLDHEVEIKFTTTADGKVETYLAMKLEDVAFSHYSISSSGDMPVETLSLNYDKITKTFTAHDTKVSGSPETVGYHLSQMKKI